ncbi:hypothetical protein OSSY52_02570 [Tepiditoga spiralis]|uniref:NFACT RNA-binding domain-containing protein n=1 Tax=Tepiditoga spiralis TaxID=2108365 RepID=A0A7G1G4H8_9BACT|nr:NFACT family protein [Tepiditoga spiralis]BBE30116.1 hypothetical protein OSSY52_02570 [Tepiditoga spiralis]
MPIDGLVIHKLINEINTETTGMTIKNIYQPVNHQLLIKLNKKNILFSLRNPAYIVLLNEKPDVPDSPQNFSLLLRKKIKGGKIVNVKQMGLDRIGYIEIKNRNELGDLKIFKLYFELMGKSNLILVNDENKIIDALKKSTDSMRSILPGAKYIPYYDDSKALIFDDINLLDFPFMGFSKKSEEILRKIGIEKARNQIKNNTVYYFKDLEKPDVSSITPENYIYEELSPSEGILKLFEERTKKSKIIETKKKLEKIVIKNIEKNERTKNNLLKDISKEEKLPEMIKKGELLQSYLYTAKRGDKFIEVTDWESGKKVKIELNPLKNPTTNLEKYFKKIKKTKTMVEFSKNRIKKFIKELEYLYQLWETIDSSEDIETLEEIHEEMFLVGLIKSKKKRKIKKVKNSYRHFEYMNFEIYVGKNNKQNDELTKNAYKEDIWLHTQGIPGSHTIIKSAGKEVPLKVIEYAASLAATFSRAKLSSNVAVDYTQRKNVWKPGGAKPGMVLYKNYKTIITNPILKLIKNI